MSTPEPRLLFHIAEPGDWHAAQASGTYAPPSLSAEGFIHCSTAETLATAAATHYAGRAGEVVVLTIDPTALDAPVVHEDLYGHGAYPHIYGPVAVAAVLEVAPLTDVG